MTVCVCTRSYHMNTIYTLMNTKEAWFIFYLRKQALPNSSREENEQKVRCTRKYDRQSGGCVSRQRESQIR